MKRKFLYIVLIAFATISCSDYQKLLKSNDPELKYERAVAYFEQKDYMRAQTLFDDVSTYYKGTERSEEILFYLCRCYMGQKDYYTASEYYKTYVRTYPKGRYVIEAKYMVGYCYYLDSPDPRLDQTATRNAIEALQEFIDIYPESNFVQDANKLLEELANKLAYKELLNARLYYNLGTYLGDNYEAAKIVAQNALNNYPTNQYREEFCFIMLNSKYQQTLLSVDEKKEERRQETIDEYYSYIGEFPEGKYRKNAERIFAHIKNK